MTPSDDDRFHEGKTSGDVARLLAKGQQLYSQGQFGHAEELVNKILNINPNLAQAHFLFGLLTLQDNDLFMAEQAFKQTINLDEKMAAAWVNLAKVFALTNKPEDCQEALRETISLKSEDPRVWEILGQIFQKLGQIEDANTWLTKAGDAMPLAIAVNTSKIFNLIYMGEKEQARSDIHRMLERYPDEAYLHYALSKIEKAKDRSHIEAMEAIRDHNPNSQDQFIIDYALGKEHEDLQEWASAFSYFEKGAKAKRKTIKYDENEQANFFKYLKNTLNQDWLQSVGAGNESASPIFIIGLPRTGTTLVEQIISAHSKVMSAGELQHVPLLVKSLSETETNPSASSNMNSILNINISTFASRYLKSTAIYTKDAPHFVDKLPQNFFYAPLIAAAFPNVKILHLRRNPMDSCFANYKQLFTETYHYSYDMQEMARYFANYHSMMDTWRALLPDRIFDIDYESLVTDFEPSSKAIIKHLRLEWEDSCLEFYNQRSAVATASASQVREKVHSESVGRWKEYKEQLQPMYKILKENQLID